MVTSTTTHPAFAKLFRELFQQHGHIYEYPMHEESRGYKWKLAVRLDNSFQFLILSAERTVEELSSDRSAFLSWLAGLIDADGTIYLANDQQHARISLTIANERLGVLESIARILGILGYHASGPYLAYKAGVTTPYGITYKNDLWRLFLQRSEEVQQLLRELPIRHSEKVAQKELACSMKQPTRWVDVEAKVRQLRRLVKHGTNEFRELAKKTYLERRNPVRETEPV